MNAEYIVPGRIELLGKHVDYAGGRSLTCAVDLAVHARVNSVGEPVIRLASQGWAGTAEIPLDPTFDAARLPSWAKYSAVAARRFARDFPDARTGIVLELTSDLPASSGLSSSSAIVIATAMALMDANEIRSDMFPNTLALAEYFAAMESGTPFGPTEGDSGVGVRGGAQDHVAIMCAEQGMVSQFSYIPARLERRIAWPDDYVLVLGVSGVEATKTANAQQQYNRASDVTRALLATWNASTGHSAATLADALACTPFALGELAEIASEPIGEFDARTLTTRLMQFVEESEKHVPMAGNALHDREYSEFGTIVERANYFGELALENHVPETTHLERSAVKFGAVAASAFGAGFGGAVWAMARATEADVFVERWSSDYRAAFPERSARWIITRPASPARRITLSS
jgi:galactokinase